MPVENIYALGSIMYNKKNPNSALSESLLSYFGDILEDDELSEETLKLVKDKDDSVKKYWRYLTPAQAKAKKSDRDELEALAADVDDRNSEDDTVKDKD